MSDPTPPLPPYLSDNEEFRPIEVFVAPPPERHPYWLHALLLVLTILTTLVVGARLEYNFLHNLPAFSFAEDALPMFPMRWILHQPSRLLLGIPFAGTLMAILLAHEMGHYVYCLRYGVNATLPFFIPAPTLIGTLGAFIRIKSPIRSREALFDIGIAGPIAGFIVACGVLAYALWNSKPMPPTIHDGDIMFGMPLIFGAMNRFLSLLHGAGSWQAPLSHVYLNPIAIAAWVGMFATALNLLPGGQLDGGHIVYSVSPRAHKHISRMTVGALLPMGYFLWPGWFVWAVLLTISGMRHPQVPLYPPIAGSRRLLSLIGIIMLVLTFVPEPFRGIALQ